MEIVDLGNGDGSPQAGETFTLIPHVISNGELELPAGAEVILTIVEGATTLPATLTPDRQTINGGAPMAIGDRATTDAPHFTIEIPEWPDCCETGQILVLSALADIPGGGQISLGTPPALVVQ